VIRRAGVQHEGAAATAGVLTMTTPPAGLVLGQDPSGAPLTIRVFRPRPTQILLVDRGWLQRLLVFRALALGALVVVNTPEPANWEGFGESLAGAPDRVITAPPHQPIDVPPSAAQPTLFVAERHLMELPVLRPWQTRLTVAAWFGDYLAQPLAQADVTILRRLSPRALAAAAPLMHLDAAQATALQTTPADGLAAYEAGSWRYVRLAVTSIEQRLFGPPS
jgi:hypothetical protein